MAGDLALPGDYAALLGELKDRIRSAQPRAALAVNRELVLLYWHIGQAILGQQAQAGWGAGVVQQFSHHLGREFPDLKGLSPRSLQYVAQFAAVWLDLEIVQQLVSHLLWGHNVALLQSSRIQVPARGTPGHH